VPELFLKLSASAVLTVIIKILVAAFNHSIAWWLAAAIALVLVFGGWLIVINADGAWD
jgi:hypothetical protein